MEQFLIWFVGSLAGGFGGSFLAGYLKKKGENLATHEDLDKLVEQMKATTEATKSIEAAIEGNVWDRQRQWEMKRDAVFDVIKALGKVENALLGLYSSRAAPIPDNEVGRIEIMRTRLEKSLNWNSLGGDFDGTRTVVALVAAIELNKALDEFILTVRLVANAIITDNPKQYMASQRGIMERRNAVLLAARKELGIGNIQLASLTALQSNESSAALGPG